MIFNSNTSVKNSQNFVFKLISAHLVDQNSYTHTHIVCHPYKLTQAFAVSSSLFKKKRTEKRGERIQKKRETKKKPERLSQEQSQQQHMVPKTTIKIWCTHTTTTTTTSKLSPNQSCLLLLALVHDQQKRSSADSFFFFFFSGDQTKPD